MSIYIYIYLGLYTFKLTILCRIFKMNNLPQCAHKKNSFCYLHNEDAVKITNIYTCKIIYINL